MLSVIEAMSLAKVSRATIFNWIKQGRIERLKLPGKKVILINEEKYKLFLQTGVWPNDEK
jgi:predicted site-specific integrase-resolvase